MQRRLHDTMLLLTVALLMHLKHGLISFGSTKQLNFILQPI